MAATVAQATGEGRFPRLGELRRRAAAAVRAGARRAADPVRAPLANLVQIPLTVAGIGCVDAAAFQGPTWVGLLVTGVSLFGLEHLIADDE